MGHIAVSFKISQYGVDCGSFLMPLLGFVPDDPNRFVSHLTSIPNYRLKMVALFSHTLIINNHTSFFPVHIKACKTVLIHLQHFAITGNYP